MCADDQLWEVGPNGTKGCGKIPQILIPCGEGSCVCATPNRGPCLGGEKKVLSGRGGLGAEGGCRHDRRFDLNSAVSRHCFS